MPNENLRKRVEKIMSETMLSVAVQTVNEGERPTLEKPVDALIALITQREDELKAVFLAALPEDESWDKECDGCKYCLFPKGWNAARANVIRALAAWEDGK